MAASCLGALVMFAVVVIGFCLLFLITGEQPTGPTLGAVGIWSVMGAPLGAVAGAVLWQLRQRRRPK
jgi:hypothetical protein